MSSWGNMLVQAFSLAVQALGMHCHLNSACLIVITSTLVSSPSDILCLILMERWENYILF